MPRRVPVVQPKQPYSFAADRLGQDRKPAHPELRPFGAFRRHIAEQHRRTGQPVHPQASTKLAIRAAFEKAGIDFIDENGGGPGVRLRRSERRR